MCAVKIGRETRTLRFVTPTRCEHVWTFTLKNHTTGNLPGVYIWLDTYLPQLDVRDRSNRKLLVLPRYELDKKQKKEQADREKKGEPSIPLIIAFDKPLRPGQYENIKLTYTIAYGSQEGRSGERAQDVVVIRHQWGLVGYVDYILTFSQSEGASKYISVTAPERYSLDVYSTKPKPLEILKDERSYMSRPIPDLIQFTIGVPERVASWLILGLVGAIISGPLSFLLFFFNIGTVTSDLALVGASFTVLIAMRVLLFENVFLLNRLNRLYLLAFVINALSLALVASFPLVLRVPPPSLPSNETVG